MRNSIREFLRPALEWVYFKLDDYLFGDSFVNEEDDNG